MNALIYMNYVNLSEFHSLLGDAIKSEHFLQKAKEVKKAIDRLLWCEEERMWFDYDLYNDVGQGLSNQT